MSRSPARCFSTLIPGLGLVIALGVASGCGKKTALTPQDARKPKEVSRVIAAEAENYMSDAMFAFQIKDFARAEQSIAKAVKLRDDIPDWWLHLGIARKKLRKTEDAKAAYRTALALHQRVYARTKDPEFIEGQLYILLLLDQEKEARSLLGKAMRDHPDNEHIKTLNKAKGIDQLLRDPALRENKL